MRPVYLLTWIFLQLSVAPLWAQLEPSNNQRIDSRKPPQVMVLGIAQDAGFPQTGCQNSCCEAAWTTIERRRMPTCLAIVDPESQQRWLLDCTWQLPFQLDRLNRRFPAKETPGIDGIFLTHGHIGHYTGLMHLGREVMGAKQVAVYAMPRMANFLNTNGPWSLLVKLENISIQPLKADQRISLNNRLHVTPIQVPHRAEYTETVAFLVESPNKSLLYLPDIDKWSRWEQPIEKLIQRVDLAFLDATFYANGEIPGRDMSQIPHPFIQESLLRFQSLTESQRRKIHFIHMNHTNPALNPQSDAREQIQRAGMNVAEEGDVHDL